MSQCEKCDRHPMNGLALCDRCIRFYGGPPMPRPATEADALGLITHDRDTWKARALKANADLERMQHEIMMRGAGRATSEAHKAITMHRILVAWLKVPELRLGQMLMNAVCVGPAIRMLEDDFLAEAAECFAGVKR